VYFSKKVLEQSPELKKKWEDEVKKAVAKRSDQKERWSTISDLEIKRIYGPEDIKDMDFERDIGYPGQFPYLRGNQVTGYRGQYWTFRMFAGMGSAKDTNERWHMLLKQGHTTPAIRTRGENAANAALQSIPSRIFCNSLTKFRWTRLRRP